MKTTNYNSLSLKEKMEFYNETIGENNSRNWDFPYFMEMSDENFRELLNRIGYEELCGAIANSIYKSETLDIEEDTHFLYDSDNAIFIGVNANGGAEEVSEFDDTFGDAILTEMECIENHDLDIREFVEGEVCYDANKGIDCLFFSKLQDKNIYVVSSLDDKNDKWLVDNMYLYKYCKDYVAKRTNEPICYEHNDIGDYPYYCPNLDENLYQLEVIKK